MTALETTLQDFIFEIKRSNRRKTLCLQIRDGRVQAMVPAHTPDSQINDLVDRHKDWIREKLHEQAARPKAEARNFVSGEFFPYLGRDHQLCIRTGAPWPAEMINGKIVVTVPARLKECDLRSAIKERLHEWYRVMALEKFQTQTGQFSGKLGVVVKAVKVKNYRRRWGSCSARGELSFNWRLIMAPSTVIDYVVAHEVAHLVYHNHSPEFWVVVDRLMPTYRHQQNWLNQNGGLLDI